MSAKKYQLVNLVSDDEIECIGLKPAPAKRAVAGSSSRVQGTSRQTLTPAPILSVSQFNPKSQIQTPRGSAGQVLKRGISTSASASVSKRLKANVDPEIEIIRISRSTPTVIQKRVASEVIEISDDETPELKKVKLSSPPRSTSPIDYMDVDDSRIWKPIPVNKERMIRETANALEQDFAHLAIEPDVVGEQKRARIVRPDISVPPPRSKIDVKGQFVWDLIRCAENYRIRPIRTLLSSMPRVLPRRELAVDLDLQRLAVTTRFKRCPGGITRIVQKDGWVAVGGACIGGNTDGEADPENEVISPYNEPGSLVTWTRLGGEHLRVQEGHQRVRPGGNKYYAVNDVKFDPCSPSFVSSGYDRRVMVCDRKETSGEHEAYSESSFLHRFKSGVPHDMAFKPATSVLAVGERSVHVFSSIRPGAQSSTVRIVPANESHRHVIGAVRWGSGPTENQIFASSEPLEENCFDGHHRTADATSSKDSYKFDASEAGDALVLNPSGSALIMTTRGFDNQNIMYLYDVRRKDGKNKLKMDLEPYSSDVEAEVHDISFSSDGIYLALARHDNQTHVYDFRMLKREPLWRFKHQGECKTGQNGKSCGVMKLEWVESTVRSRLGLVTGGSDGCVRLWDPLLSIEDPSNGSVIADVASDIGTFSLGDRFKQEHQLIVGDCTGEIFIFDRLHKLWGE
ncbi:WD40 repeat-like protein [Coprinopsis marcescibilis]|uniref:WD40 repeat-like protein n=1 Tax=Coprinopsis marcescibilis TaxID=230819 RepID=A0A5C3LM10_COPMA|nr:WD40 repeat-like protein [Coprinopsis marcescibilis]